LHRGGRCEGSSFGGLGRRARLPGGPDGGCRAPGGLSTSREAHSRTTRISRVRLNAGFPPRSARSQLTFGDVLLTSFWGLCFLARRSLETVGPPSRAVAERGRIGVWRYLVPTTRPGSRRAGTFEGLIVGPAGSQVARLPIHAQKPIPAVGKVALLRCGGPPPVSGRADRRRRRAYGGVPTDMPSPPHMMIQADRQDQAEESTTGPPKAGKHSRRPTALADRPARGKPRRENRRAGARVGFWQTTPLGAGAAGGPPHAAGAGPGWVCKRCGFARLGAGPRCGS